MVSVFILALGIGSSTVVFSVFYHWLIDPFPYKDSNRLVTFGIRNLTNKGSAAGRDFFLLDEFRELKAQNHVFDDMVGYERSSSVLYRDVSGTRALPGIAFVTGNTFDFYGVSPRLGRALSPEDANPNSSAVFVMNYRLWRSEFNSDPAILGKTFVLNGEPRTLVGIMPPRFDLYDVGLWAPLKANLGEGMLQAVGRIRPGVQARTAAADLDLILHQLTKNERFALNPEQYTVVLETLLHRSVGSFEKALYALLAAVLMLLLIACANVANLLLARTTVRERELAVRIALGATAGRLFRYLMMESLLLALAASMSGTVLAHFGLKVVVSMIPAQPLPAEAGIALDWRVLPFALGITVPCAVLCGLAPAIHSTRRDLTETLASSNKSIAGGRPQTLSALLVVAEAALSIVLLVGGGLFMHNFIELTRTDLPFDPARMFYARLALPRDRYYDQKADKKPAFFEDLIPRIKALPGVVSVTESLMVPPDEGAWTDVIIPGKPHSERWTTDLELCTEGYFQTLRLPLRRGRLLVHGDVEAKKYVAVVNETLARRYFGGEDPIGRKIKFEVFDRPFVDAPHNTYFEIVGVVADFKTRPDRTAYTLRPEAFLPASTAAFGYPLHILARTSVDPHSVVGSFSQRVWSVDPDVAISGAGSVEDLLQKDFRGPRFEGMILGTFAVLGLVLVAIGIFSVTSYSVSVRMKEIGVRMALGADRTSVLGMVVKRGLGQIAVGSLMGLGVSVVLTRFVRDLLWGAPAIDRWVFSAAFAILVLIGSAACVVPALRAAWVDPIEVLRCE